MPRIMLAGYVIDAEALPREGGSMPSATIRDDRANVDSDDVTDDCHRPQGYPLPDPTAGDQPCRSAGTAVGGAEGLTTLLFQSL
jgi:hypothetical protein